MRLFIDGLVPLPLKDKIERGSSSVWRQSLTFNNGEYVFIQAPSGTGKSTFIHLLYGIRKDYEGKASWEGFEMENISSENLATLRTSYISIIFQDLRLLPDMTVWENLEIKRRLTNAVSEEEAAEWLERLGMKDKKNSKANTLSYGEQQRVAIIRALLQPFDWLMMDEPFSHLDKLNAGKAINLITEVVMLNKAGMILADLDENYYFPYSRTITL